jgi:hypothetical protein
MQMSVMFITVNSIRQDVSASQLANGEAQTR